jgi:hypothetical protein
MGSYAFRCRSSRMGAVLPALSIAAPSQRFRAERQFLLRQARKAAADATADGGASVAMLRGA